MNQPTRTPEQWLHDLRNAVNSAVMAASVVKELVKRDERERALGFIEDLEVACDRCRILAKDVPQQWQSPTR